MLASTLALSTADADHAQEVMLTVVINALRGSVGCQTERSETMGGQVENLVGKVPTEVAINIRTDAFIRDNDINGIKRFCTPEIIAEHKANPIGFHSEQLERVLFWMRKNALAMTSKYVIVCTKPHEEWCLGKVSGIRGVPPEVLKDQCFSSRLEAEHGVFLARLKDCGLV